MLSGTKRRPARTGVGTRALSPIKAASLSAAIKNKVRVDTKIIVELPKRKLRFRDRGNGDDS